MTLFLGKFLILFLVTQAAFALSLKTVAQESSKAKFDFDNKSKPGICFEIMSAIEKIDPDIKFVEKETQAPLKRIEELLEKNTIDVFFGFLKTEDRLTKMIFGEIPIFPIKHKVAVAKQDTVQVSSLQDIKNLGDQGKVVTVQGAAYEKFLKDKGLIVDAGTKDFKSNIKKVLSQRARFFYNSDLNLKEGQLESEVGQTFKILPAVFSSEDSYVTFSKKLSAESIEKVMAAIKKLKASGELDAIAKKYLGD